MLANPVNRQRLRPFIKVTQSSSVLISTLSFHLRLVGSCLTLQVRTTRQLRSNKLGSVRPVKGFRPCLVGCSAVKTTSGLSAFLISWISSSLSIRDDAVRSKTFSVNNGGPQGSLFHPFYLLPPLTASDFPSAAPFLSLPTMLFCNTCFPAYIDLDRCAFTASLNCDFGHISTYNYTNQTT